MGITKLSQRWYLYVWGSVWAALCGAAPPSQEIADQTPERSRLHRGDGGVGSSHKVPPRPFPSLPVQPAVPVADLSTPSDHLPRWRQDLKY